jgi:hypothetical protein
LNGAGKVTLLVVDVAHEEPRLAAIVCCHEAHVDRLPGRAGLSARRGQAWGAERGAARAARMEGVEHIDTVGGGAITATVGLGDADAVG